MNPSPALLDGFVAVLPNSNRGRIDIGYDEEPHKRKETIPCFSKNLGDTRGSTMAE
jgi:hypothetical protein